ncbi:TIGR01457 family HAD-type hydrolase [Salirhabdus salicampi]|uniref:TIGR01457 family HAD-type hydrolase n=1 Tax=Salirhabdus salicampi TaxID=476102 RepID=UPI0020C4D9E3|nr:TIGR01457 family HAD-type hydrolase [Salirhabdus salicampi]MCP8617753.1 TIGR01457 family HAD-type hydrolase [Salirhabdus salicampi]
MKDYRGYLIDLDGTMYRGSEPIEYAKEFIYALRERNIPHLFVTNNSSKKPEQVAEKLQSMGIPAQTEQIFTTSMATAAYINQQHNNPRVYMIGEEGLRYALETVDATLVEESADFVVVGIDRGITYEKLAKGCLNIRNGAKFVSTNGDVAIPTERGMLPGNGSLTSVLSVSTGVKPVFIGKPESLIMELALQKLGLTVDETIMVGDNYNTDILAGIQTGMDTLLVFGGVTSKEDLEGVAHQPTYTVSTLQEWIEKTLS